LKKRYGVQNRTFRVVVSTKQRGLIYRDKWQLKNRPNSKQIRECHYRTNACYTCPNGYERPFTQFPGRHHESVERKYRI